jgi:hypothetical protein
MRMLVLCIVMLWIAGCHSLQPQREPIVHSRPSARPPARPLRSSISPPPSVPSRAARVPERKSPQSLPQTVAPPTIAPPTITLENSYAAKSDAQRLIEEASLKLAHIDRTSLTDNTASTYNQANELINAAHKAAAEQDYLAASSLAQKASALTSQLPQPTSR